MLTHVTQPEPMHGFFRFTYSLAAKNCQTVRRQAKSPAIERSGPINSPDSWIPTGLSGGLGAGSYLGAETVRPVPTCLWVCPVGERFTECVKKLSLPTEGNLAGTRRRYGGLRFASTGPMRP
jgi:hypothetical protein